MGTHELIPVELALQRSDYESARALLRGRESPPLALDMSDTRLAFNRGGTGCLVWLFASEIAMTIALFLGIYDGGSAGPYALFGCLGALFGLPLLFIRTSRRKTKRLHAEIHRTLAELDDGKLSEAVNQQVTLEARVTPHSDERVVDHLRWTGARLRAELGYWSQAFPLLSIGHADGFSSSKTVGDFISRKELGRLRIEAAAMSGHIEQATAWLERYAEEFSKGSEEAELRLLVAACRSRSDGLDDQTREELLALEGSTGTARAAFFRSFLRVDPSGPSFRSEGQLHPELMLGYLDSRDCLRFCADCPELEAHRLGLLDELSD